VVSLNFAHPVYNIYTVR